MNKCIYYWEGRFSLGTTWIIFILINVIFAVTGLLAMIGFMFYFLALAIQVFLLVGLWRSAKKAPKWAELLTKALILLPVAMLIYNIYQIFIA